MYGKEGGTALVSGMVWALLISATMGACVTIIIGVSSYIKRNRS